MRIDVVTGSINPYISDIKKMMEIMQGNGGVAAPPPKTPSEVAAFMAKLGITPTNNKEQDMAAMTTRLAELNASAKTEADYQKISLLYAEFNSITQSGASQPPNALEPSKQSTGAEFTGMEQLGQMNKHFLIKKQVLKQS